MIRLIVKLGAWLDHRFPVKVIVTQLQYAQLNEELSVLRAELKDNGLSLNKALERLSVVESNAVHREPVRILVDELQRLKADYASYKASMGFRDQPIVNAEIQAMLNGLPIGESNV